MRKAKLFILLSLLLAALIPSLNNKINVDNRQSINSVLGDISFICKFGYPPDRITNDALRIKTHLEFFHYRCF